MLDQSHLVLSDDKQAVFVHVTAQDRAITATDIKALLVRSPYGHYEIDNSAIEDAVVKFSQVIEDPLLLEGERILVQLATAVNASIEIEIADNKMAAWGIIVAAKGGTHITAAQLSEAMRNAGIRNGLQKNRAINLLKLALSAPPGQRIRKVIALGRKPEDGIDSRFERLVETLKERMLVPKERDDGTVDMRELGSFVTVEPGMPLMLRHPYVEGHSGLTITGTEVPFYRGKEIDFDAGEGVDIDENDNNRLIATKTGLPLETENGMKVDDALIIDNVDIGTGNIDFPGSVLVSGNIAEGMSVKAGGDVHVAGFVESAQIESGGDIVVTQGVIGHRVQEGTMHYSCEINCKGSFNAGFVQYSKVTAKKAIFVTNQLLHSSVDSGQEVSVIDKAGRKGTIVGGKVHAGGRISTIVLGAQAGTATELSIMGEYTQIVARYHELQDAEKQCHDEISRVIKAQLGLKREADAAVRKELSDQLDQEINQHRSDLYRISKELEDNVQQTEDFLDSAKVIVRKELHPNIRLKIADKQHFNKKTLGPSESVFEAGVLDFKSLGS
ncbi:DUF342 domain-containing protein [Alginatibacterium sediminis]|uniref:DUF342 domain-containing protein n=1 Tax=Alginatibacterium sediminis TaxID=2164068 RepID=A0A420E744_9ALTE|nr:FapA family protein [Alginatibacterium sediminis]RKF14284.1 DUF342 domain-containing protein [Alginatibacterium sediminis]